MVNNKVFLIGRLTKDIEVKQTQTSMVVRNTLAVDGVDKTTDFIGIVVFGKTAVNLHQFCGKGSLIAIEGHIHTYKYDEKYITDIVVDTLQFLDSKKPQAKQEPINIPNTPFDGESPF